MRARRIGRTSPSPISMSGLRLTAEDSVDKLKGEISRLRKRNKILVVLSLIIVVLVSLIVFSPLLVPQVSAAIVRVQNYARGTSTTTSLTVTQATNATNGNVNVLVYGGTDYDSGRSSSSLSVSSISQTGVTWTQQIAHNTGDASGRTNIRAEIWYGVVGAGASTTITLTIAAGHTKSEVADVCEYSGLLTTGFLDQTFWKQELIGSAAPNTGGTATTTQASELWIGVTAADGASTQSTPTNGFTLQDGANYNSYESAAYLEYIASSTGVANCSTTASVSTIWVGCIATFKAAATTDYPPTYTTIGSNETVAGNPVNCYVLWVQNSTAPSYFIFGTNNTGPWVNQTAAAVSSNWGNYSFTLNTTVGVKVQWEEWCNDTGGSWNNTGLQTITTTYYETFTVVTTTHSWTLNPGDINQTVIGTWINLTVTSNANFDVQVEGSGALTDGAGHTIALNNIWAGASVVTSSVALTTSFQNVTGLTNVASCTSANVAFKLWANVPNPQYAGTYTYTLTCQIVQYPS